MIVRTVLGDIDPAELGPCDAHEHLFLDTPAQPGEEFLDVGKAIEVGPAGRAQHLAGHRGVVLRAPTAMRVRTHMALQVAPVLVG